MTAPCKDCTVREIGCHSVCEKYICYREERTKILDERREKASNEYWLTKKQSLWIKEQVRRQYR